MTEDLQCSPVELADLHISDALDALGFDSTEVAESLIRHPAVAGQSVDEDPVCLYLQACLDPGGQWVQIQECDLQTVSFAVRNLDTLTWTHSVTVVPSPVRVFCCRLDAGDFPELGSGR